MIDEKKLIDRLQNIEYIRCPSFECWEHSSKDCGNCKEREIKYGEVVKIVHELAFKHNIKQTNADRIRSMTDEELAEWIHNMAQFELADEPMLSIWDLDKKREIDIHDSYGDLLKWLQSEVEE